MEEEKIDNNKEIEVEGNIKLVINESSQIEIDLKTKSEEKHVPIYKSTIDEPIKDTLVPFFIFLLLFPSFKDQRF